MIIKKILLLHALFFVLLSQNQAQTTISFCTAMREEHCVFNNTKFITSPDSSTAEIVMLVRNAQGLGSSKIVYKLFSLGNKGEEQFLSSITQNAEANWVYAWQSGTFKTPGRFKVKVFNDQDEQLCSKSFEFFDVW